MPRNALSVVLSVSFSLGFAACGSGPAPDAEVPLRIVTVDEDGVQVPARRVQYQAQPADAFWIGAQDARCETGTPPCAVWVIDDPFEQRIAVTAERVTEATATDACQPYASTFATVHPGTAARPFQLLHLTLPSYGTYCVDEDTGRALINVSHAEQLGPDDELVAPVAPTGIIRLALRDPDGEPVPGTSAFWYYAPEGPDYDGEHPLGCADARCETWISLPGDEPRAGTVYLTASYAGPLNPFSQQGWTGYDGAPFTLVADTGGALLPLEATLTLSTVDESATGG